MDEREFEALNQRLVELKIEHRDLDDAIAVLTTKDRFDQLQIQRLKRRKLRLKDEIQRLNDELFGSATDRIDPWSSTPRWRHRVQLFGFGAGSTGKGDRAWAPIPSAI